MPESNPTPDRAVKRPVYAGVMTTPYEKLCQAYKGWFDEQMDYRAKAQEAVVKVLIALRKFLEAPDKVVFYAPPSAEDGSSHSYSPRGAVEHVGEGWWEGRLVVRVSRENELPESYRAFVVRAFYEPDTSYITYEVGHWKLPVKVTKLDAEGTMSVVEELFRQALDFHKDQLDDFIQSNRPDS